MNKKQKYLFIGIIIVSVAVFILIGVNRAPAEEPVAETTEPGTYDNKLEAYISEEKNQRLIAEGSSYFKPDSILTEDGSMVSNPNKTETVTPEELVDMDEMRELRREVTETAREINGTASPRPMSGLQFAGGERIHYDEQRRAYTKDGSIDERAMGQEAVDKYLAAKRAGGADPVEDQQPETEAQRRKRRIEESMGIRAVEGTRIAAVVHTTQVVGDGQEAVFRVVQDTRCGNLTIPKNTLLSAATKISGNRIRFVVGSLRINGQYYVVSLSGYSPDGGEGMALNISGEKKAFNSEVKDAALSGAQRAIGSTAIGNALTGIVRGVTRASDRETNVTVKLIDNQPINFLSE